MANTKEFDKLAEEFRTLNERSRELKPLIRNATIEAYRTGVQVSYILDRLAVSPATLYNWLKEAGGGVLPDTPKKVGRPRKNAVKQLEEVRKVFDSASFAWWDDKIRVDSNGKRVLIDPERLDYEGDRELGQLLVSGTDLALLRKFNEFVNGG